MLDLLLLELGILGRAQGGAGKGEIHAVTDKYLRAQDFFSWELKVAKFYTQKGLDKKKLVRSWCS